MNTTRRKRAFQLDELIHKVKKAKEEKPKSSQLEETVVGGCLRCGTKYESERALLLHVKEHYPDLIYLGHEEPQNDCLTSSDLIVDTPCTTSGKENYRKTMTPLLTNGMPTMIENNNENDQKESNDLPYFMCSDCCLTFADADGYNEHLDSHLRSRKAHHMSDTTSTDSMDFRCIHCDSNFKDVNQYQEHLKRHGFSSHFTCQACGQTFSTDFELNRHMGSHTGGTFECSDCGKCFTTRKHLHCHAKTHEITEDIQIDQLSCTECGKCFSHRKTLKNHQRYCCKEDKKTETSDSEICGECGDVVCNDDTLNSDCHKCNQTRPRSQPSSVTQVDTSIEVTIDTELSPPNTTEEHLSANYSPVKHSLANDYLNGLMKGICKRQSKKNRNKKHTLSKPVKIDDAILLHSPVVLVTDETEKPENECKKDTEDVSPLHNDYFKNLVQSNVRKYNRQRMRDPLTDYMTGKSDEFDSSDLFPLIRKTFVT